MTALDVFLGELTTLGIRLAVNGDKLRVEGPRGAITPELRAALAASKPAILARLRAGRTPGACGACRGTNFWYSVHGAVVCWTCHPPANLDLVNWWTL